MFQTIGLLNRLATGFILFAAGLTLSACVSTSSLDQLAGTTPSGSAFSQALFHNYAYLARSFGQSADTSGSLFDSGNDLDTLAEAFATKALLAAKGSEVEPEPASSDSAGLRDRLVRALAEGKDRFPSDAARAQADFDCWMLNSTVASQAAAAGQCHASFNNTLGRLESDLHPRAFVPPTSSAAPAASYSVYFNFGSWTLAGEQLTTLQQAIAAARAGRQTRISIVGHTDTSGAVEHNQALSLKRANAVAETLVDMGARREAIQTSGVGESDPVVQTGDDVKEARNRRAVVTLLP
jgi:outer membrane protein OmpA-like peptidoglycan-associated protein